MCPNWGLSRTDWTSWKGRTLSKCCHGSAGLRGRHELHFDAECACQRAERGGRRVGLAALDAADLGLVDAGHLGELLLR